MVRRVMRRAVFTRVFRTLGLLLGLMQVLLVHFALYVLPGRPGPGLLALGGAVAGVTTANALLVPALRRARRSGPRARRVARIYMATGVVTLLLGTAVAACWLALYPLSQLAVLLGVTPETGWLLFRAGSGAATGGLALLLVWGFTLGREQVERTHVRVPLRGLPLELEGLRIVQISDLHIGNRLHGELLGKLVDDVNRHDPDLIAVTGDIFDSDPAFVEDGSRRLAGLRARHGVFAVIGNHDTYTGTEHVAAALAEHAPGLRLLRDECVRLPFPAPLYVAGVDDPGRVEWSARSISLPALDRLAATLPEDGPVVLLVHRPEAFPQASRLGFPLVLAGHTHGGQLALPLPGGRLNLARLVTRFDRGLYRENGSTLYVNRGLGFAGPALRVNCPREITTIELALHAAGDLAGEEQPVDGAAPLRVRFEPSSRVA